MPSAAVIILTLSHAAFASLSIYFLRKGDVWQADAEGGHQTAVTHTNGKAGGFLLSPERDLLAYTKTIGWEEEHNDDSDAKPAQVPVTSLAVVRMPTEELVFELPREGFSGISLIHWTPDGKLRFFETGQLEVIGLFEFDSKTRKTNPVDHYLSEADYSAKANAVVYATDSGIGESFRDTLYVQNLATSERRSFVAVRGTVSGTFFPDGRRVAYVAVESNGGGGYKDRYGVCRMDNGSCTTLYEGPSRPKAAGMQELHPSPDGRRLAMLTFKDSFVVSVDKPGEIKRVPDVRGAACWLDGEHLLLSRGEGITSFDVSSGSEKLLIPDASLPIVFR